MKKRVWSVLLAAVMLLSLSVSALAEEPVEQEDSAISEGADIGEVTTNEETAAVDANQEPADSAEPDSDKNADLLSNEDDGSVIVADGWFIYDPMTQVTSVDNVQLFDDEYVLSFPADGTSYKDVAAQNEILELMYAQIEAFFADDTEPTSTNWGATSTAYELVFTDLPDTVTRSNFGSYLYAAYSMYDNDHPYETCTLANTVGYDFEYSPSQYRVYFSCWDGYTEKRTALKAAVDSFDAEFQAANLSTEFEKYKFIHNYLCENLTYNTSAANSNDSSAANTNAHNAYGALVGGDGCEKGCVVCQGYSDAFLLLCQKEGLPCVYVSGTAYSSTYSGVSHGWNHVKIGDDWYAIDCTWDDEANTMTMSGAVKMTVDLDYTYFTDNSYFVTSKDDVNYDNGKNHLIGNAYNFSNGSWVINAPALAENSSLNDGMVPPKATITFLTNSDGSYVDKSFATVSALLASYMTDIKTINIYLPDGVTFDNYKRHTNSGVLFDGYCTVPSGRTYNVYGDSNAAASLSKSSGNNFSFFIVEDGGTLTLNNIAIQEVNGVSFAVQCKSGGKVALNGECSIMGNTNSSGNAANLYLAEENQLTVGDTFSGNVGISFPNDITYPFTLGTSSSGTAASAFLADNNDTSGLFRVSNGLLLYTKTVTTSEAMPVYFQYMVGMTIPTDETTVTLSVGNTSIDIRKVTVYAASYQNGKMLNVSKCDIDSSNSAVTLPAAASGADLYKVFALDSNNTPCSEALVLSASYSN